MSDRTRGAAAIAMLALEQYPMAIRCEGLRDRPRGVKLLASGSWRVDWVDGLVSTYRGDPREHLRLGYEPKHLRRSDRGEGR